MSIQHKEVFSTELLESLGLDYSQVMVRTLNKTGYMRNYLCEISAKFCSQSLSNEDAFLDVGCGIGAALNRLIQNGAKNVVGVDSAETHLDIVRTLLEQTIRDYPAARFTTICDSLPNLAKLEGNAFSSILCAQVLHYLKPPEFEAALKRLHQLLKPGGNLYVTVGSPYIEAYQGFGEEYEKRLARNDRYPGFLEDVRKYHPDGSNHNPGYFLFFEPDLLSERLSEAGFNIIEASHIDMVEGKRVQTGVIATKK